MIKLAIFDMDGTVFESRLDWRAIRDRLEVKPGQSILREIYGGERVDERRLAVLERYEKENTMRAGVIDGASEFLCHLKERGIIVVLITNNNRENTDYLLNKHQLCFDLVITRESGLWKPDPEPFLHVMESYGRAPSETISIGDSHYDVKASKAAGLEHIYIIAGSASVPAGGNPDVVFFDDYFHLRRILDVDMSTSIASGGGSAAG
jgi:HAD superfamily hydrolase (TIGR01509 family)